MLDHYYLSHILMSISNINLYTLDTIKYNTFVDSSSSRHSTNPCLIPIVSLGLEVKYDTI